MNFKQSQSFQWKHVKQFNIVQVILAFVLPSLFACVGFRWLLQYLVAQGAPKILVWPIVAAAMLLILVIIGFFLVNKESQQLGISLQQRLLFKRIPTKQWMISLGVLFVGLAVSAGLSSSVALFQQLPGLAIPEYMPFWLNPAIDPLQTSLEVLSPGYPIQGNYLLLLIMAVALLLNILAEEVYFRAWLLPKMQGFGKWGWFLNALFFTLYHAFQLWLFPIIFVVSLATTFTVHKTKSILPAFTIHLVANFLMTVLGLLALVMGLKS